MAWKILLKHPCSGSECSNTLCLSSPLSEFVFPFRGLSKILVLKLNLARPWITFSHVYNFIYFFHCCYYWTKLNHMVEICFFAAFLPAAITSQDNKAEANASSRLLFLLRVTQNPSGEEHLLFNITCLFLFSSHLPVKSHERNPNGRAKIRAIRQLLLLAFSSLIFWTSQWQISSMPEPRGRKTV